MADKKFMHTNSGEIKQVSTGDGITIPSMTITDGGSNTIDIASDLALASHSHTNIGTTMTDVDLTDIQDGDALVYSSADSKFVPFGLGDGEPTGWPIHQYGVVGGGYTSTYVNNMDYFDMSITSGNSSDRGDLSVARRASDGGAGDTNGYFGGGQGASVYGTIDYINQTTTSGNASSVGTLTIARTYIAGLKSADYTFWAHGASSTNYNQTRIDYISNTTTTGNAVTKGEMPIALNGPGSCSGDAYGICGGGYNGSYLNNMSYFDNTTTSGGGSDRSDISVARIYMPGGAGDTYGFFMGGRISSGSKSNIIDYIILANTSGNAADRADLTASRETGAGVADDTYCYCCGGTTGSNSNIIDYINATTITGSCLDHGDLSVARFQAGGSS